jgi:hypothetical protein
MQYQGLQHRTRRGYLHTETEGHCGSADTISNVMTVSPGRNQTHIVKYLLTRDTPCSGYPTDLGVGTDVDDYYIVAFVDQS